MLNRYLQIGVVALSLGLLFALFATTKPGDTSRPDTLMAGETDAKDEIKTPQKDSAETKAPGASQSSRAVLSVQGMTCSGCIAQIKSSLAGLEGIGDVRVDLANGQVEVTYDSERLKDTKRIAAAITAAGYPATLKQVLTAKDIDKVNRRKLSKSERYIARVGDWEVLRADFNTELSHARKRYEKVYGKDVFEGERGANLLDGLKSQVARRLIDEGVQLNEIRKTDYQLDPDTLKKSFNEFLTQRSLTPDEFKRSVAESGLEYKYFLKKFEYRVTINAYVEDKVLSGVSTEQERQQQYADWYSNAQLLAEIVYYDKDIESSLQSGSGTSGCLRSGTGKNAPSASGCKSNCIRKSSATKTDCGSGCSRTSGTDKAGCSGKCKRQ